MARFVQGSRCVVVSFHPNPLPTSNRPCRDDGLNGGMLVRPTAFKSGSQFRRISKVAGRYYEVEYVGLREQDGAPMFRPLTRLRISATDEIELGGADAPGFDEAVEFVERGVPLIASAGPRP